MGMKKNNPGCGCCGGDVCTNCTNITYVSISGLANANCTGGCDGKNGTYVFRLSGDPIPSNCNWTVKEWPGHNCGLDDTPSLYIGGCTTQATSIALKLTNVTGGIKVTVEVKLEYRVGANSPNPAYENSYLVKWEDTFSDCASISGSLPWLSTTVSFGTCGTGGDGTGDLCGLASATVSIG